MGKVIATHAYSLKSFIYRVLIRRLVLTGGLIALGVGLMTFFIQFSLLEQQIIQTAHDRMAILQARARVIAVDRRLHPTQAFLQALKEFPAGAIAHTNGHIVCGCVYDRQGRTILDWSTPSGAIPADVQTRIHSTSMHFPRAQEVWKERFDIDGKWYLHFVGPITATDGTIQAYAGVVFAVAPDVLRGLKRRLAFTVSLVVGIVLVTTVLLYPVILRLLRRLIAFSDDLLDANLGALSLLGSAVAKRDSDTDAHNYRVTLYAVRLAETLQIDEGQIRTLIKGAFLHDVGKIGIRDDILLKPGRLDEIEFSTMQTHVQHGADIVAESPWLEDSLAVVTAHHEKYDGSGYPSGLKGDAIPAVARIFAIADVFDALTSLRPYKPALPLVEVQKIMQAGRGTHFDPGMLDAFQTLAPGLHADIGKQSLEDLRRELVALLHRYFSSGIETLSY